jgi:hypothetical protein
MPKIRTKICETCATAQKLTWLPCASHSPAVDPALCRHDFTSQTLIHNGVGIKCHDCGAHVALETVGGSDV